MRRVQKQPQQNDRHRGQRGSVLSAVLIIVAFLSILVGGIMTELTNSFLISGTLVTRTQREATITSAVELGINQLQNTAVPAVCARDTRGPWFLTLNGSPSAVTETCTAIVPDVATDLAAGAFTVDGVRNTTAGRDQYIAGDSGGLLSAYAFGQTGRDWAVSLGGPVTAPPLPRVDDDGVPELLVATASGVSGCGGNCVALMHYDGAVPSMHCTMPASSAIRSAPALEAGPFSSRRFPDYVFFSGTGAGGNLYVYDAAADHSCSQLASAPIGGSAIGSPLVLSGPISSKGKTNTVSDEVFLLVNGSGGPSLEQWSYTESTDSSGTTDSLTEVGSIALSGQVGASAVGYDTSAAFAPVGGSLRMVIAGAGGGVAMVQISLSSKVVYSVSPAGSTSVPGAISRSPYWCHCPGQDLIGVGSTNGTLYLLSPALALVWSYSGQVDGSPAIDSVPHADANGDWYFGAADGFVYDVEIPLTGQQMFKAARFGPGGSIVSSPVVGGCGSGSCVYFASTTAGSYFVSIGSTRIVDLRACVSVGAGSTTCGANPRLWARVEVGAAVGGSGVQVQGWSYYSP